MEDSIIDELYNAKCDDFEGNIMQEEKGCNKNLDLILSSFKKIQKIVPKDISVNVSDELDNIYINILKYFSFWTKKYYKLGIKDGVKLKQEVKTDYRQRKEKEPKFKDT